MSAIEKLRESLSDNRAHIASHIAELARAVLAEHDAAPPVPPSGRAKAWRKRLVAEIRWWVTTTTQEGMDIRWNAHVAPILDEAVRLMSVASEPVAEAPKRLRAGWRGETEAAVHSYRLQSANQEVWWCRVGALLDEAEASAAQQPVRVERAIEITALKTEIRRLLNQVDRANRIIDALLVQP